MAEKTESTANITITAVGKKVTIKLTFDPCIKMNKKKLPLSAQVALEMFSLYTESHRDEVES